MSKQIPEGFKVSAEIAGTTSSTACVLRARQILEVLPFKELLTTRQLAERCKVTLMYFRHHVSDTKIVANKYALRASQFVWGSERTIKELKKQNAETE